MTPNCLLTGFNGFLGKIVTPNLEKDFNLYKLGRESGDIKCDLSINKPQLDVRLKLVVHLAGKAHSTPKNAKESNDFFKINYQGTINLIKGIENSIDKETTIVFISTVAVYGLNSGQEIKEDFKAEPNTPYGQSKLDAELWLKEFCRKKNSKLTILRLPLIVGPKPLGNLGSMINAINSGKYLSIGDGSAKKSMVLASDVANLISSNKLREGVFNLTDGNHPSFRDLEVFISNKLNVKRVRRISKHVAKFLGYCGDIIGTRFPVNSLTIQKLSSSLTFDDSKARKEMQWTPCHVLSDDNWLNI